MLRLGIDEREEDDLATVVGHIPFVINQDLAHQYDKGFLVSLDKKQRPVVETLP
ncbi:MAG: hypothetical protein FWH34_07915 [Desulfovibrionaceae bacterium]|nr:hypothetical protein [Desulfovibrionaceae bacterium]